MVLTLAIPIRWIYGLQDFITLRHLRHMGEVMLATGMIVAYGYLMETFIAWYGNTSYEKFMIANRMFGPYGWIFGLLVLFNILVPQTLWSRRVRESVPALFVIAICVNLGMWLERFVIVIVSLHRDFLPSSWGMYAPTIWDWGAFTGSIGLFLALMFLFIRVLPMISIFELRGLVTKVDDGKPA